MRRRVATRRRRVQCSLLDSEPCLSRWWPTAASSRAPSSSGLSASRRARPVASSVPGRLEVPSAFQTCWRKQPVHTAHGAVGSAAAGSVRNIRTFPLPVFAAGPFCEVPPRPQTTAGTRGGCMMYVSFLNLASEDKKFWAGASLGARLPLASHHGKTPPRSTDRDRNSTPNWGVFWT